MSTAAHFSSFERDPAPAQRLRLLADRPDWLMAALDRERVLEALARHIPEVGMGALRLIDCETPRLFLKDASGCWRGIYQVTIEQLPEAHREIVPIRVTLAAPGLPTLYGAEQPAARPFGAEGWQCDLPELHLHCELEPPDPPLEILPQLTDPAQARALVQDAIRTCSPPNSDIRIEGIRPEVLNLKPGSRCTLRYDLTYAAADVIQGWPDTVIAKTYQKSSGEQAYEGMLALWRSPLARSKSVGIAEPLAYLPELELLIQAPLAEEQTLEELLRSALRAGARSPGSAEASELFERLQRFVRAAATGLAELHLSGARASEIVTWDERVVELPELLDRLAVVAPNLTDAVMPLFDRLRALASASPADPLVPSHGSFDSDQVLIAGDQISFIDFDSFCMAEPSLDVGHFRAAIMDSGMQLIDEDALSDPAQRQAYLERLDTLGALFLAQYESHAPIAHQRLALWEALDYLRDALHLWKKPQPENPERVMSILEYHLRGMGLLA